MATLYGINLSPYARKVLIFAAEAGIELEHRDDIIPLNKTEELLAVSPRGKVPGFKDGDLAFGESGVICAYLDKRDGPTGLYPADTREFGWALFLERYADEEVVAATGPIFFNRVVSKLAGFECNEEEIRECQEVKQPAVFGWLEEQIGDKSFLVGDSVTIADVATYAPFVNLTIADEAVGADKYPNLVRYLSGLAERPAFKKYTEMTLETAKALAG